jgi:hypothetical protein
MTLLDRARNDFSQNGDDGIIDAIFEKIGESSRLACEFGAWDGVHLSNTRALILKGWRAVLLEADPARFADLERNYRDMPGVVCIQAAVDDRENRLDQIFSDAKITDELDLLVVDVDGLDYYVVASLELRPRVLCVEVNAGHYPASTQLVPREVAACDVGQPLGAFAQLLATMNYRLIAYNGNAYFLRNDIDGFPALSPLDAYRQASERRDAELQRWLYLVNRGSVHPYHRFRNPLLRARPPGLSPIDVAKAALRSAPGRIALRMRQER